MTTLRVEVMPSAVVTVTRATLPLAALTRTVDALAAPRVRPAMSATRTEATLLPSTVIVPPLTATLKFAVSATGEPMPVVEAPKVTASPLTASKINQSSPFSVTMPARNVDTSLPTLLPVTLMGPETLARMVVPMTLPSFQTMSTVWPPWALGNI